MVKLDWNPKSLEVKCSKETLKFKQEMEKKYIFFYKCVQILKNASISRKALDSAKILNSAEEKDTKNVNLTDSIDGVPISRHTLLHIHQPKRSKKITIDQAHMQLRMKVRVLRHLFGSLFKSTDLKN